MHKSFKKIAIIYNSQIETSKDVALNLNSKITNSQIFSIDNLEENVDLAIIVGGDGTFLKAGRFYSKYQVPILGFNVGHLGYLTQAKIEEIDFVLEKLIKQDYKIENRLMLKHNNYTALNDIVIKGDNYARSSDFVLYINDKEVCSYIADGLIVATPTGSTAYSLSAGGPIINPMVDCFLIIPICPHTLNTRPLIVPIKEKIKIKTLEKNQKLNVSFDGQVDIEENNEIEIEKGENCAKLLILNKQKDKFYDILKEKLNWSLPNRKK